MDDAARRVLDAEDRKCQHCGRPVDGGQHVVTAMTVDDWGPHEVRFHGRKGPCLNAALRLDPENVSDQRARYDAEWERIKRWRAERR